MSFLQAFVSSKEIESHPIIECVMPGITRGSECVMARVIKRSECSTPLNPSYRRCY